MRNFLIAGNWKMNYGPGKTRSLLENLSEELSELPDGVDGLVCPPFISLPAAAELLASFDGMALGAQDVHWEEQGAFTGEVSTDMLHEIGCDYVILGHSERREYFGETDKTINQKVCKSLSEGLKPIICVGESLQQRKADKHVRLVKKQIQAALTEVAKEDITAITIAYEPIWAIGTGETATPEQAQEMHVMIREQLEDLADKQVADSIQILYGGSMKPHNAEELLSQPDVDGGLIGGASLKADSFADIIRIAGRLA